MVIHNSRKYFFYLFVILLPVVSIYISFRAKQEKKKVIANDLPVLSKDSLPDFTLIAHTGDTITRKSVEGKILVADFFFTKCRGICPVMSKQMARIQSSLSNNESVGKKFIMLSHTVAPGNDSVATLRQYAELYGADPTYWLLVTGNKQQLYDLAINFYKLPALETPEDSLNPFAHSERFILVDRNGLIRGYYDGTDSTSVDKLMNDITKIDIRDAVRKKKKEKEIVIKSQQSAGDRQQ
ncbi:MAG: SCO family protein [Chitinophagales bacterium]|nr:SCO family protein [Chitinophagales bacterium]